MNQQDRIRYILDGIYKMNGLFGRMLCQDGKSLLPCAAAEDESFHLMPRAADESGTQHEEKSAKAVSSKEKGLAAPAVMPRVEDEPSDPSPALFSQNEREPDPVICSAALSALIIGSLQEDGYHLIRDGEYLYLAGWMDPREIPFAADGRTLPASRSAVNCRTESICDRAVLIWGPYSEEVRTDYQNRLYLASRGADIQRLRIPCMFSEKAWEIVQFAHGLLTEDYHRTMQLNRAPSQNLSAEYIHERMGSYLTDEILNTHIHHSLREEDLSIRRILTDPGELNGPDDPLWQAEDQTEEYGIGQMAESKTKNLEYNTVCTITLLTRYAIEMGGDENEAYQLSDIYLQELSKADNIPTYNLIKNSFIRDVRKLIRKTDSQHNDLIYITQSKDYIARHIFEKLSLNDVAAGIGLNPSYLSRLFSEDQGVTITDYILRQKILRSCNLLKYSDRSIAEIAEYVALSPQSYFSRVFKKITGETPARYRRNNFNSSYFGRMPEGQNKQRTRNG